MEGPGNGNGVNVKVLLDRRAALLAELDGLNKALAEAQAAIADALGLLKGTGRKRGRPRKSKGEEVPA